MQKAIVTKTTDSISKLPFSLYGIVEIKHIYRTGRCKYYGIKVRGHNEWQYFDSDCFLKYEEVKQMDERLYNRINSLLKTLKNTLNNESCSLLDQCYTTMAISSSISNLLKEAQ